MSTRRKFSMRQGCNEHLKARRTEVPGNRGNGKESENVELDDTKEGK